MGSGRRVSKTVAGVTTSFLYDADDIVEEQTSGGASANILGGGLDRFFSRADASGTVSPLVDGLGSPIALADSSGTVQTQYTYEPFGGTSVSGTTSTNVSQYAGRENDGTGLYYYRARYYSPSLQRFISEDPIGLLGGINSYAYAVNNPISFNDPYGLLSWTDAVGFAAGLADSVPKFGLGGPPPSFREMLSWGGITFSDCSYKAGIYTGVALQIAAVVAEPFLAPQLEAEIAAAEERAAAAAEGEALAGGGACFVAGTIVLTPDGGKPIEALKVGDEVLSSAPGCDGNPTQTVTRTFVRSSPVVLDIQVGGETITATPEHPFWVLGHGWVRAANLVRGSPLLTENGTEVRVASISRRQGSFTVYNIEVSTAHTYYVSGLEILVHNQCKARPTGAYDIEFESGKPYSGKGPESRMNRSARRIERDFSDGVVSKTHYPAASDREALIKEDELIEQHGGAQSEGNLKTYNKINSPGKKLRGRKP